MTLLEDKIKKNRESLDSVEPEEGHFGRFEAKLKALHEIKSGQQRIGLTQVWKVAAIIFVLISISLALYFINPDTQVNQTVASDLPLKLKEAKMYYDQVAAKKLNQINQCAISPDEAFRIRQMAEQEITQLDSNSVELENEIKQGKDNPRLVNALIQNYKTKSDLVEDILKRLCNI